MSRACNRCGADATSHYAGFSRRTGETLCRLCNAKAERPTTLTGAERRLLAALEEWERPENAARRPMHQLYPLIGAEVQTARRLWDRNPALVFVGAGNVARLTDEGRAVEAAGRAALESSK